MTEELLKNYIKSCQVANAILVYGNLDSTSMQDFDKLNYVRFTNIKMKILHLQLLIQRLSNHFWSLFHFTMKKTS